MPYSQRSPFSARIAPVLIALMLLTAAACIASATQRADWLSQTAAQAGFTPWPGNDPSDSLRLWLHGPGPSLRLIDLDGPDTSSYVIATGFALWMSALVWLLRGTAVVYVATIGSLGLTLLVTGGIRSHGTLSTGLVVDAGRAIYAEYGQAASLCAVTDFAVDRRAAAKGGPDYWLVAHPAHGAPTDITVFSARAPAEYLLAQYEAARHAACPAL